MTSREAPRNRQGSARRFVAHVLGDAFSGSTVLEPKIKELIAIACLTATGHGTKQLRSHALEAIRAGYTAKEIVEVVVQSVGHSGDVAPVPALRIIKEVFEQSTKTTP